MNLNLSFRALHLEKSGLETFAQNAGHRGFAIQLEADLRTSVAKL
jgi:hypothetical protein